ncbi:MAG: adenylate/guanylate cyclase domain-containing protein [Elusimicrobia bacterium]|nr:adenylate/guanylate cyclase domain-containing protein [Elusimicrobiota bacterium]
MERVFENRPLGILALAFLCSAAAWGAAKTPPLRSLEAKSLDVFLRRRGPRPPSGNIAIIAIDEKTLETLREPFAFYLRRVADAAERAYKAGAVAVGIDLVQPREYAGPEFREGARKIERLIRLRKNTIFAYRIYPKLEVSSFLRSLENAGVAHLTRDPDGFIRRQRLAFEQAPGVVRPSFALQVYRRARGDCRAATSADAGAEPLIDYAGPRGTFPAYSLVDVLRGRVPARAFQERVVLIGDTSNEGQDIHLTPLSRIMPGVEVHANALNTLLSGFPLREAPAWWGAVFTSALALLMAGSSLGLGMGGSAGLLGLATALYVFVSYGVFLRYGVKLDLAGPLLAMPAAFFSIHGRRYALERRQRALLHRLFSEQVSPRIVETMLGAPPQAVLRGESLELSILFSDIENFTTLSELLPPGTLVAILNEYFSEMVEIIFKEDGTVGKFIGDGLMAYWGAPLPQTDHADRAARAALAMTRRSEVFSRKWKNRLPLPFHIRVGIHTGAAVVGNIGSVRHREFTALGDNVNIASRLEGLNKSFGSAILISSGTREKLDGRFACRSLGRCELKGKNRLVEVYALDGFQN